MTSAACRPGGHAGLCHVALGVPPYRPEGQAAQAAARDSGYPDARPRERGHGRCRGGHRGPPRLPSPRPTVREPSLAWRCLRAGSARYWAGSCWRPVSTGSRCLRATGVLSSSSSPPSACRCWRPPIWRWSCCSCGRVPLLARLRNGGIAGQRDQSGRGPTRTLSTIASAMAAGGALGVVAHGFSASRGGPVASFGTSRVLCRGGPRHHRPATTAMVRTRVWVTAETFPAACRGRRDGSDYEGAERPTGPPGTEEEAMTRLSRRCRCRSTASTPGRGTGRPPQHGGWMEGPEAPGSSG